MKSFNFQGSFRIRLFPLFDDCEELDSDGPDEPKINVSVIIIPGQSNDM